jgi:hypothetical protein
LAFDIRHLHLVFLLPGPPAVDYSPAPAVPASGFPLRWWQRLVLVGAGAILVGLLATAACLKPSSRGYGTHQGLGLPPCTVVVWYGMRCPSCGMTTSWAHMTRGQVVLAVQANSGGALLAIIAATVGPWILASGLIGRWLGGPPRESLTIAVGLAVVVTTLIDWSLRLYWGG